MKKQVRIENPDKAMIGYNDDVATRDALFQKVVDWYLYHGAFIGEVIMQSDDTQLTAAELLSEIADDILEFDVSWDEE